MSPEGPALILPENMGKNNFNIIIAGIGGQGIITLTSIIAEAALEEGLDVKTSELHGLSQKGGSVLTHIRMGKEVFSPLVAGGKADLILSLEISEGLRRINYSNSGTAFIINEAYSPHHNSWSQKKVVSELKKNKNLNLVPASEICEEKLDKEVLAGVYLLGYAVFRDILPLKAESLIKGISKAVPNKYLELNKKAFNLAND